MDSIFMDQHFLRSSLRLYTGEAIDAENNNANSLFSAAMVEKARAHLQLWNRAGAASAYNPSELHAFLVNSSNPQMFLGQRPGVPLLGGHLYSGSPWQTPIHQSLPPGLLGARPQITPPPASTPSSSGSPSPTSISTSQSELRLPKPVFPSTLHHRFSPYATPLIRSVASSLSPTGSRTSHWLGYLQNWYLTAQITRWMLSQRVSFYDKNTVNFSVFLLRCKDVRL